MGNERVQGAVVLDWDVKGWLLRKEAQTQAAQVIADLLWVNS